MSSPKKKFDNSTNSNNNDQIRRAQLQMQFHSTRREDFQTVEAYVKKLKSTADSLTAIGNPVSDPDLVLQLLAGLPSPQYLLIKNSISSQSPLPNFSKACSMLYEYEKKTTTSGGGAAAAAAAAAGSSNSSNDDQIRRAQLQMQFHSTSREDFQTIEAYVEKLKSIANSLAEMDSPVSDSEMVFELLAGLPTQYKSFKKTITSRRPLPKFDEACSILYMQEDILLQEQSTSDPDAGDAEQSSSFFTKEKFYTVVDALGTFTAVVGAAGTVCAAAGPVGTVIGGAVGAVNASRIIALGAGSAFGAITAMAGWKFGKQSTSNSSN